MTTLAEQFMRERGGTIEYAGLLVHAVYVRELHARSMCTLSFEKVGGARRQGVALTVQNARLIVDGEVGKKFVLWSDTAPDKVPVECTHVKGGAALKIWNVWEYDKIMHAWIGNAGMLVREDADSTVLECSDGIGEVSFGDVIVRLQWE